MGGITEMKLKNWMLKPMTEMIGNLTLKGKVSRHRTKFVNTLIELEKEKEEDRIELLREYAMKDENGDMVVDENNNVKFNSEEDVLEYQKDYQELMNEEPLINISEETKEVVTKLMLDGDFEVGGNNAQAYDSICEMLEGEEE